MYKRIIPLLIIAALLCPRAGAAESDWAKGPISSARRIGLAPAGILNNYQKAITREEFCALAVNLYSHLSKDEIEKDLQSPFSDTQNPVVSAAYSLKIVKGVSETEFAPGAPISRQEICVMLARALSAARADMAPASSYPNTFPDEEEIAPWAKISVSYMNMLGIMLGKDDNFIDPKGQTTREEAIVLTYRIVDLLSQKASAEFESMFFPLDGNTDANVSEGAFAIYHDKAMYIINDGELYTAALGGGVLKLGPAAWHNGAVYSHLAISGANIFYINKADGRAIYKAAKTGGANEKIMDGPAEFLYNAASGVMYLSEGFFYRINADGSGKTKILDEEVQKPVLSGLYLYYLNDGKLFRGRTDTGEITAISDINVRDFQVVNNLIYFINEDDDDKLYRIKADGSGLKAMSRFAVGPFNTGASWIFAGAADGSGLYKINYEGTAAIRIDTEAPLAINTIGDYVYLKGEKGIYALRDDSTGKVYLAD